MPFTPTHIAAILPIAVHCRQRLPFSALVIGSQIPDLPLYIPRILSYGDERVLHSVEGLLAGCLPLGLLGFIWFQGFVKEPLFDVLPRAFRQRLAPLRKPLLEPRFGFVVAVLVAVALGAATHVLWDSFTHYENWGYRLVPGMDRIVVSRGAYQLEAYKALQYGSSLVLLPPLALVLLWWLQQLPVHPLPVSRLNRRQRGTSLAVLLLGPPLAAIAWSIIYSMKQLATPRAFTVELLTTLGLLQFIAVNAYVGWYRASPAGYLVKVCRLTKI